MHTLQVSRDCVANPLSRLRHPRIDLRQTLAVNAFQSVILGLVQGLTEFLPISSTAHLRIVPALLNWEDPGAAASAVIQLGTMAAVVAYFWRDLLRIALAWTRHLNRRSLASMVGREKIRPPHPLRGGEHEDHGNRNEDALRDAALGWYLVIATIPIGLAGFAFRNQIETAARDLRLVSIMLIVFGALLWWVDVAFPQTRSVKEFNLRSALVFGMAQALALIPGVSRSGATITAGRAMGFSREAAARFSFLLSIPAVVLSGLYQAVSNIGTSAIQWGPTVIATLMAFVSGYASIAWLLKYVATHSMRSFAVYRFVLAGPVLVLAAVGAIA